MSAKTSSSEPNEVQNKINKDIPFISVKELKKILGVDAKGLDDKYIRNISVGLGKIALLLTNNPDLFNNLTEIKGDQNYGFEEKRN